MSNDLINGCFELASGLLCSINIYKLIQDKEIKGISWIPTLFFTSWGAWNLYYYPSLGQILSFLGGISIFTANIIWVGLVLYYKYKNKRKKYKLPTSYEIVPGGLILPYSREYYNQPIIDETDINNPPSGD